MVIHMEQGHLIPQARFALAQGVDPAPDRRHALADIEVEPLHKPTFKGVWSLGANFAPLPLPDTRLGQYLRRHTR